MSQNQKTNNQKKGEHYVVDGAVFKCQQGAVPCQISVVSQPKVTAQNKSIVTENDVTFVSPASPFATCMLNPTPSGPGPCMYSNGKWNPQSLLSHGGKKSAIESSSIICPKGGKISCVYHGQVQCVTPSDFKKVGVEVANLFSYRFVFTMPEDGVKKTTAAVYSVSASRLMIRSNDVISLHAYKEKKQKKELGSNEIVNWAITTRREIDVEKKGKSSPVKETYLDKLMIYKKVSSPFNITLPEPGIYHIEGGSDNMLKHYTKENYTTKNGNVHVSFDYNKPITSNNYLPSDKGCELIVEVLEHNRIQSISLLGDYIKGDGADSYILKSSDEVKVVVHTAVPLVDGEQLRLMIDKHLTQDVAVEMPKMVSVIADTECSSYYFKLKPSFFNNRNSKKIDVVLTEGNSISRTNYFNSGFIDSKSLTIKEVDGYVSANVSHDIFGKNPIPKDSSVRPGTTVCLTVSPAESYDKVLDLKDAVWEIVENKVSQEPKPKGSLAFHRLKTEGKVTIKLDLGKCNSVINNKKWGMTQYVHTFNVSRNVIKGVDTPRVCYPGISYTINFDLLYEYDCLADSKVLKFKLDGKEKELTSNSYAVSLDTLGDHSVRYGKNGKFDFKVVSPIVKTWQFSDDRNNIINEVGLDETFYLDIDIPAWADYQKNVLNGDAGIGKVQFFLWENKVEDADPIVIESLENAKMGDDGKAHIALKISKDELAQHLGTYQFPEKISIIASLINPPYAASELLSQKSGNPGHWVYNSAIPLTLVTQPCVNGFFSGKSGNPQKSVMKYGDSMLIMLTTHNCKNQLDKITVELVENDKKGEEDDKKIAVYSNIDFDENGKAKIDICGDIKEDEHGDNPNPRLFYFRVYLDGKQIFTYPQSPADVYDMTYKEAEGKSDTAEVELDGVSYSISKSDDSCDYESALKVRSYLWQLKVGKDKEIERLNRTLTMMAPVVVGEELKKGEKGTENGSACPRCHEEVEDMYTRIINSGVFSAEAYENLRTICEIYCKYMRQLLMDTCWIKVHFFAQISVESGVGLTPKAENMNYSLGRLKEVFPTRLSQIKNLDVRLNDIYGDKTLSNIDRCKKIAGLVYGERDDLGNQTREDGWKYRGGGYIQVTGKSNYESVGRGMAAVGASGFDMNNGTSELLGNVELSTLASMVYLYQRCIFGTNIANGQKNTFLVNKKVGKKVEVNEKTRETNYDQKQKAFDKLKDAFEVDKCDWKKNVLTSEEGTNIYRIYLDEYKYFLYQENPESKDYVYEMYNEGKIVRKFIFKSHKITTYTKTSKKYNDYEALLFPETSKDAENNTIFKDPIFDVVPKWGRFGQGNMESDNWISPKTCASLLGFFYSLQLQKDKGSYKGFLYYNDITVYNPRDPTQKDGHEGHKLGEDIDIRYPGSNTGGDSEKTWNEIVDKYYNGDEKSFILVLQQIINVARKWNFKNNFVHKPKRVIGAGSREYHEDHFHLGCIHA